MWPVANVLDRALYVYSQVDLPRDTPSVPIRSPRVNPHFSELIVGSLVRDRGSGDRSRTHSFPGLCVGLLIVYMIAFVKGLPL